MHAPESSMHIELVRILNKKVNFSTGFSVWFSLIHCSTSKNGVYGSKLKWKSIVSTVQGEMPTKNTFTTGCYIKNCFSCVWFLLHLTLVYLKRIHKIRDTTMQIVWLLVFITLNLFRMEGRTKLLSNMEWPTTRCRFWYIWCIIKLIKWTQCAWCQ